MRYTTIALALATLTACSGGEPTTAMLDAGPPSDASPDAGGDGSPDAAQGDAGLVDAGDAGELDDAGSDAGNRLDAGQDSGHDAGPPPPMECELLARECDVGACKIALPEGIGTRCAPSGLSDSVDGCDFGECQVGMMCVYARPPGSTGAVAACHRFCRLDGDDCREREHCSATFDELTAYTTEHGEIPLTFPDGFGICIR